MSKKENIIDLQKVLEGKWEDGTRPKDLYAQYIKDNPKLYVESIISGLCCGLRRVENGCAELASLLSEDEPAVIFPHVNLFLDNLNSKEKIVRWEAVCTLGNLAKVDDKCVIVAAIPKIVPLLRDKSIVLAGHSVRALAKMGAAYPKKTKEIFQALVGAENAFENNKIGFVIEAMALLIPTAQVDSPIEKFVTPYTQSEIKVVATKANKVMKALKKC